MTTLAGRHHDDVIKWKHFPRYWRFVRGIYRSPVNSPHKGQWRGDLIFALICTKINGCVNSRKAGDLSLHRAHYDVTAKAFNFVMHSYGSHYQVWPTLYIYNVIFRMFLEMKLPVVVARPILGLSPANERRRYKVTPSLFGWALTYDQPCIAYTRTDTLHELFIHWCTPAWGCR